MKRFFLVLGEVEGTGKSTVGHWLYERLQKEGYSVKIKKGGVLCL